MLDLDVLEHAADTLTLAADKLDALAVCMSPTNSNPVTSGWNDGRETWNNPVTQLVGQVGQMERGSGMTTPKIVLLTAGFRA